MEGAQIRLDLVQYYMGWNLPILLHQSHHDDHSCSNAIFWEVLRIVKLASVCTHLGMHSLYSMSESANFFRFW